MKVLDEEDESNWKYLILYHTHTGLKINGKCFTAPSVELSSKVQKSQWEALGSSIYQNRFPFSWAIDANAATIWASNQQLKPWLRVRMDAEHWVKGIRVGVREYLGERMKHLEVGEKHISHLINQSFWQLFAGKSWQRGCAF